MADLNGCPRRPCYSSVLLGGVAPALAIALLIGCGGDSDPDDLLVSQMTTLLQQENTRHYAFACADLEGTVLSREPSPDAIAQDAGIDELHAASAWVSDTGGVILGTEDQLQYTIVYDPASEPTNAQAFEQREATVGDGKLFCLVPE